MTRRNKLIAGGIALGALLDRSGLVRVLAERLPLDAAPSVVRLLLLCLTCALLSALMSNTGTASFLIPLAATIDPSPSTAIIVAGSYHRCGLSPDFRPTRSAATISVRSVPLEALSSLSTQGS